MQSDRNVTSIKPHTKYEKYKLFSARASDAMRNSIDYFLLYLYVNRSLRFRVFYIAQVLEGLETRPTPTPTSTYNKLCEVVAAGLSDVIVNATDLDARLLR